VGLLWFILGFAAGLGSLFSFQVWLSPRLRTYIKKYSLVPKFSTSASKSYDANKEQLHQNHQEIAKLRRVIQNAPIGYLEVDEDNRMSWCNKKACYLLGIQSCQDEVAIQRLLLQMVRSYELDQLIEQTRHIQKPAKQEWVFHSVAPDPLYPVEQQDRALRAQSIVLEDGHIGIFVVDRQEVANLTQQRDRWAADVAHELKTPLTSIRLIAEVLQGRLEPSLYVTGLTECCKK
jgi:two-component system, OmpR family, phosphate regulon sensor histidine kinase PhoR